MSRGGAPPPEAVSGAHLREAERGFIALLRSKGFPAAWVEHNALDLLAQAAGEYTAWMGTHKPEANPVGWLITCAYRRALNLLEAQRRRPPTASVDAALEIADKAAPTPEQEILDDERQRRLRRAIGHLEPRERRLITLVYFDGRSIREAGRRLGWRKSAADRHHRAALERLRALLGEDRNLLSPAALGLAVWAAAGGRDSGLLRRLGEGMRRLVPFAEPGSLAVSGGAAKVAGACGAGLAAALCGLVATGVDPSLPGSADQSRPSTAPHLAAPASAAPASEPLVLAPRVPRARVGGPTAAGIVDRRKSSGRPRPRPAMPRLLPASPPDPGRPRHLNRWSKSSASRRAPANHRPRSR